MGRSYILPNTSLAGLRTIPARFRRERSERLSADDQTHPVPEERQNDELQHEDGTTKLDRHGLGRDSGCGRRTEPVPLRPRGLNKRTERSPESSASFRRDFGESRLRD
jgi:hypothetical protein